MQILSDLGVNSTIWIHLCYFIVAYVFVSQFIFKPYSRNLKFRKKNTTEGVDEAQKMLAHTDNMALEYEMKVKAQNEKVLSIYGQLKHEGVEEEHRILHQAKLRADKIINEANQKISSQIKQAETELKKDIPAMSKVAAEKLLGRNI